MYQIYQKPQGIHFFNGYLVGVEGYRRFADEVEKRLFKRVLDAAGGNRTEAVRVLGLSRNTPAKRLKDLRLGE